jgi:hypothetical protein
VFLSSSFIYQQAKRLSPLLILGFSVGALCHPAGEFPLRQGWTTSFLFGILVSSLDMSSLPTRGPSTRQKLTVLHIIKANNILISSSFNSIKRFLKYITQNQKLLHPLPSGTLALSLLLYRSSAGSRWKRSATSSTASCTLSRVASLVAASGPAITGSKDMVGSWLRKHVKTYSITARQSLPPSASRRAPRIWSRHWRRTAAESSTGSASEIDVDSSDTGMGLIPSGTSVVLASPAHAAMCWTSACCSA